MIPKIVFFDCDGVLITSNTWESLLKLAKFPKNENDRLWKKWIEIQSGYLRKNLTKQKYQKEIVEKILINKDAREIITYLKKKNIPVAIISSGEIDYVRAVANELKIKIFKVNTYFRFNQAGKFVRMDFHTEDPIAKVSHIKEICRLYNCLPEETFFVGDSNNDLKAFKLTQHGILYKTKDPDCQKFAWKMIENLNELKNLITV
ncbi:conserved hypothetical protein [Candidatus Roizmanbacteria bacterium]|nr:conserved hypothetical protein [Candidatus Roizmanbacteria bacterium]